MNYIYASEPKKRPILWLVLIFVSIGMILFLYSVKISALAAKSEIADLKRAIAQEEQALRLLSAELSYLQSPKRLRSLAEEYLQLQPMQVQQIIPQNRLAAKSDTPKNENRQNNRGEE